MHQCWMLYLGSIRWWRRWRRTIFNDDWRFFYRLRCRRWLVRNNRGLINSATAKAAQRITTPAMRGPSGLLFDSLRTRFDSPGALIRVTSSTLSAFSGALSTTLVGKNIAWLESSAALSLQQSCLAALSNEGPLFETQTYCSRCRGSAEDINCLHVVELHKKPDRKD